jgi:hypothetical protein
MANRRSMPVRSTCCPLLIALALPSVALATDVVTHPFYGVELIQRTETSPRPNIINILQIDLNAPGISFRHSDSDPNPPLFNGVPDETYRQTTRQYVTEQSAQLGINTSFYRLDFADPSLWTNVIGIATSNGHLYSPWDNSSQRGINISSTNVASIVTPAASRPTGFEIAEAGVQLYNAFRGSDQIVTNTVDTSPARAPGFLDLNPRSAIGITRDNRLLLVTIDGRQTGVSEGMYLDEIASLMLGLGARDALNLDGGGSTTMILDYYNDGQGPKVVNHISAERSNGAGLAGFASPLSAAPPAPPAGIRVLDEFETGFNHFAADIHFSGSNRGLAAPSKTEMSPGNAQRGAWSQKITIDAENDTTPGFLLRLLSGTGRPEFNEEMGIAGYVGYFLKTTTPGLKTSIAIDENLALSPANTEQGTFLDIIPDGQWHLYQWNLADPAQWDSFAGGNGQIDGPITTVDAIFIQGAQNSDATVFFDTLAYNPTGTLAALVPEPGMGFVLIAIATIAQRRTRRPLPAR